VLTVTAAAAVALTANTAAQAAPTTSESISQVQKDVDALNNQADAAIQKYDGAQEQLHKEQQQVNTLENQVAKQQAQVNQTLEQVGSLAASQYRNGSIDPTVQLMLSSDPSNYLDSASSLSQVSTSQAEMLKELSQQQAGLDKEKAQAEAKLADLQANAKKLSAAKADVQKKLAAAQAKLNSLTAKQREELQAKAAAAAGDASAVVDQAITSGNMTYASAAAKTAFQAAESRLGDAYVYGATGPSTFDCSGLMMWSYAQAGVSLPRTSYAQENVGTAVPLSEAEVGDLVIFNGGEHVGMYAGNGMVLHAPHTGTVVKFESISTIGSVVTVRRV